MNKRIELTATMFFTLGVLAAGSSIAATWGIYGGIQSCDTSGCDVVGFADGDRVIGHVSVDDGVVVSDTTFTETDITDYMLFLGQVVIGPDNGTLVSVNLSTDDSGEIVVGTLVISAEVDGGNAGLINIVVDRSSYLAFSIATDYLDLGIFANGSFGFSLDPSFELDADDDGVIYGLDNCPVDPNPLQENNDDDIRGDVCDPDDDNDAIGDGLDAEPLLPSNFCNGADSHIFSEYVVGPLTCAAYASITVSLSEVLTSGNLHLIAPIVNFESYFGAAGSMTVTSGDPCPDCRMVFAVAYMNLDGIDGYGAEDVLIARLLDNNNNQCLDAGDIVETDRYPTTIAQPGPLGNFRIKRHTVGSVYAWFGPENGSYVSVYAGSGRLSFGSSSFFGYIPDFMPSAAIRDNQDTRNDEIEVYADTLMLKPDIDAHVNELDGMPYDDQFLDTIILPPPGGERCGQFSGGRGQCCP